MIGTQGDFTPGALHSVTLNGQDFVVVRSETNVPRMYVDLCPHLDLPLSGGTVRGDRLICKWHGASFDTDTGEALTLPATCPLTSVQVKQDEGKLYAILDAEQIKSGDTDA